jgi:glutamate/tyrosine decarboxylase-like PLP-dependent enzyme
VRRQGLPSASKRLTAYVSSEGHYSIAKAADLLGVGSDFVRKIPVDGRFQIELPHLREAIQADRAAGLRPFCVVGSAGTVNTGAIDDLRALASLCQEEGLWYHVDGAFGALAVLDERSRPLLDGMQESDSIAFDFHKWMHVPYDAGCLLVRDSDAHWRTFSTRPAYLQECERGLAGGGRWFCELGPELSRGFRALKVWFTLMEHGVRGLGASIRRNCDQARYLGDLVRRTPDLELLAEPSLNIVCFRFRGRSVPGQSLDDLNRELVADLQEMGVAAPSTTHINGRLAVRVNITNHRTRMEDLDLLVSHAVELGRVREARGE